MEVMKNRKTAWKTVGKKERKIRKKEGNIEKETEKERRENT